jgi:hypothetical protein
VNLVKLLIGMLLYSFLERSQIDIFLDTVSSCALCVYASGIRPTKRNSSEEEEMMMMMLSTCSVNVFSLLQPTTSVGDNDYRVLHKAESGAATSIASAPRPQFRQLRDPSSRNMKFTPTKF